MERSKQPGAAETASPRELDVLRRLDAELRRRLPQWRDRGPEDPAVVLLETLARAVARLEADVASAVESLLPRLLGALGEEPSWPRAARAAIELHPAAELDVACRVPAGTGVTASRSRAGMGERTRLYFETASDAWCSPARLVRAVVLDGEDARELPIAGGEHDVALFESTGLHRHLYLGDAGWAEVRSRREDFVLEWPDAPPAVVEGDWEYSSGNAWRLLPVDFAETADSDGRRLLRMRVHGPLPDLETRTIEGSSLPWLRLALREGARATIPLPRIGWLPRSASEGDATIGGARRLTDAPAASRADPSRAHRSRAHRESPLGRAVARVLIASGDRWEDHSFAAAERIASRPLGSDWQPAVYLGWDRRSSASLVWRASPAPPSPTTSERPRLVWEYSVGDDFRPLEIDDDSDGFTRSGTLVWTAPADWERSERFGDDAFWMRARWQGGSYSRPPRVAAIVASAVEVIEGHELRDLPFSLDFGGGSRRAFLPAHPDGEIERFDVLELRRRAARFAKAAGGDAATRSDAGDSSAGWRALRRKSDDGPLGDDEFRLRRQVDGSVEVVLASPLSGIVDARAPRLRVGIGVAGDLAAGSLDVLELDDERIARVSQSHAASGGRAVESPEDFLRRVDVERGGSERAVTAEDFRRLARGFDPSVARVEVLVSPERPALVTVVVVAFAERRGPSAECARLSPRRLAAIAEHLQARVTLGRVVRVVEPQPLPLRVVVTLPGEEARLERPTDERADDFARLESFLVARWHPLSGGASCHGARLIASPDATAFAADLAEFRWSGIAGGRIRVRVEGVLAPGERLEVPCGLPVLTSVEVDGRSERDARREARGGLR